MAGERRSLLVAIEGALESGGSTLVATSLEVIDGARGDPAKTRDLLAERLAILLRAGPSASKRVCGGLLSQVLPIPALAGDWAAVQVRGPEGWGSSTTAPAGRPSPSRLRREPAAGPGSRWAVLGWRHSGHVACLRVQ